MPKRRLTQEGSLPQTTSPLDGVSELPESSPLDHVPYASPEASTSNAIATTEDPDEETEIIVIESSDTPAGRDEAESSTTPNLRSLVNPKRNRKSRKKDRRRRQQNAHVADNAQQPILRTPPRSNQPPVPQSPPPLIQGPTVLPTCRPSLRSLQLSKPLPPKLLQLEPLPSESFSSKLRALRMKWRFPGKAPSPLSFHALPRESLSRKPLSREPPSQKQVQQSPAFLSPDPSLGENDLLSSLKQHSLHEFDTKKHTPLDYKPRRALVHLFANMDSETALLYGGDNLEFWNPVSNSLIGEWSGKSKGINIGQVQPLSSSILAIVSGNTGKNKQASKAGRLSFMNASWSAEDNRFADMPVRQWTSDAPTEDISVVEGIDSEDIDDDSQVSIFTGDTSGGGVYRRIFDVSESAVTKTNQVSMINNHRGIVSALCHIQAQGRLVSGSTTGTICLNDHDSGKIVEEFNLEVGNVISSITRCPINPHLFMVGCSQPKYKLHIFDIREKLMGKRPSLTLQDAGSMATSRNNHPSWDYNTGLIVAPVRKVIFNKPTAVINTWDPRFIKCSKAETLWIHLDESEVFSVAFTKPANAEDRLIITASDDSFGITSFSQAWT